MKKTSLPNLNTTQGHFINTRIYANSRLKSRSRIADLEKSVGTTTQNDSEKAEVLNDFFTRVFTQEDFSDSPSVERSGK